MWKLRLEAGNPVWDLGIPKAGLTMIPLCCPFSGSLPSSVRHLQLRQSETVSRFSAPDWQAHKASGDPHRPCGHLFVRLWTLLKPLSWTKALLHKGGPVQMCRTEAKLLGAVGAPLCTRSQPGALGPWPSVPPVYVQLCKKLPWISCIKGDVTGDL